MNRHLKKAVVTVLGAGAIAAAAAPAALATTNTFGPRSWSPGDQTGRYRAHVGYHYITALGCGGRKDIDLRVDVISKPDISEGYYSYACGSPGMLYGHIDSYASAYRGHFMQNWSNPWYGTLRDNHQ